jgi:hypothetical protein
MIKSTKIGRLVKDTGGHLGEWHKNQRDLEPTLYLPNRHVLYSLDYRLTFEPADRYCHPLLEMNCNSRLPSAPAALTSTHPMYLRLLYQFAETTACNSNDSHRAAVSTLADIMRVSPFF